MNEIEYLTQRLILAEDIIEDLGIILINHLPACQPELAALGMRWGTKVQELAKKRLDSE
jgi:hypothetical protein